MLKQISLKERKEFYEKEFNLKKVDSWLKKLPYKPQFFVIDPGTETRIIKDKNKIRKLIFFKPNLTLKELREKLIGHMPEDVYYDRNVYRNPYKCLKEFKINFRSNFSRAPLSNNFIGQELVFDVDPENITCPNCGKKRFPKFCEICTRTAVKNAYEIYKKLKKQFKNVKLVFSGRGCHVHVLDKKAYKLSLKERSNLNKKFKKYAIDPWVSYGKVRLIRLPYSLNSLSSSIVTPLKIKEIKDFSLSKKKFLPKFLK
jgi:DNA primase catalytic subunit